MKRDPKEYLLDHSKAKVDLLKKYLDRYLGIIGNDGYTQRICIYDLFCHEGLYKNDGLGSPLVILDCVRQFCAAQRGRSKTVVKIDVYLNDKDAEKVARLKNNVRSLGLDHEEFGTVNYSTSDYRVKVQEIIELLPSLKNEKAFLFIDPYEYKHIKADQIQALMRNKNAEVLLFLPTQFMCRFDGARPIALQDFIDEIADVNNWIPNSSVFSYIEQIKAGFRKYLGSDYYVDTFTIQKDINSVFCLFFFSSHIRGFEKMLESKWEIDANEGRGWKYERSGNLFAQDRNELEEVLIIFLKEKPRTNADIFVFTLRLGYLPKHINEVLIALQQDNRIVVILPDSSKARKGAFYISYDSYKNEPIKVTIKLS